MSGDFRYKIVIPRLGEQAGDVQVIGLKETESCQQTLEEVAIRHGDIKSVERIEHDDDDNPVHDNVHLK